LVFDEFDGGNELLEGVGVICWRWWPMAAAWRSRRKKAFKLSLLVGFRSLKLV